MSHRRLHSHETSFGGSMQGGNEGHDDHDHDLLATYMDMENIEYNVGVNNHNKFMRHCFSVDQFSGFSSNNNENDNENDNNNNVKKNNTIRVASCEAKKAMPPHKLAELWNVDPKRAKRILANRQSAARSKERKAQYMHELENKVKSLQTQSTALSVQLSLFKRDTTGLTGENIELRRQLETMEQQAHLRDALNDALKQELNELKAVTGETSTPADAFALPVHNISHHPQHQTQQQQQLSGQFDSILHQSHQNQSNMSSLAHRHKYYSGHYLPLEASNLRNPLQFCRNETDMNYSSQPLDSPLEQLPTYALESNTHSPEQQVYMTSQPQIANQDHHSELQSLDINSFETYC